MKKQVISLLTIAFILFNVLPLFSVPASAADASDYGMYVRCWERYLSKDGTLYFNFVFGATKSWDVSYTAKLLDSDGKTVAAWTKTSKTILGGSDKQFYRYMFEDADDTLKVGNTYTFRVYGKCLANGKEQNFNWDYSVKYRNDLNTYSSSAYGMGATYKFYEYDYGDISFLLWLSASKDYDVTYKVRLVNPDGKSVYFWNDITIKSGTSDKKYTYNTSYAPVRDAGAYKIIVTQIVDYSGMHASYDKTFTYDFN